MAVATGLGRYLGIKKEVTWGTAVTVDRFWPVGEDGVKLSGGPEVLEGKGRYAGRVFPQLENYGVGNESYRIDTGFELYDHSQGLLWEACMGSVGTTGSGPYTHTYEWAEPLPSFTVQEVMIDSTGAARARTWAGCKVESWQVKCAVGQIATFGITWSAQSESLVTAAATNSIPTVLVPVRSHRIATTYNSVSHMVKSLTISGDNKLTYDQRRGLGTATIAREQVTNDDRDYTAELDLEFEDNFVLYQRLKNAQAANLTTTVTVGSNTLEFEAGTAAPIEATPNQGSTDIAEQPLKLRFYEWGAFAPLTVVAVNSDATS